MALVKFPKWKILPPKLRGKSYPKYDFFVIAAIWLVPTVTSFIWPSFYNEWKTQIWVMTGATNILAVWIAIVLNSDEHLEMMKSLFPRMEVLLNRLEPILEKVKPEQVPILLDRLEQISDLDEDDEDDDPFDAVAAREKLVTLTG